MSTNTCSSCGAAATCSSKRGWKQLFSHVCFRNGESKEKQEMITMYRLDCISKDLKGFFYCQFILQPRVSTYDAPDSWKTFRGLPLLASLGSHATWDTADLKMNDFTCPQGSSQHTHNLLYIRHDRCSVQFSSVAQSCPTLCDPMNRSTPGLPVHHHLLEVTQTHVHRVCDAIQPGATQTHLWNAMGVKTSDQLGKMKKALWRDQPHKMSRIQERKRNAWQWSGGKSGFITRRGSQGWKGNLETEYKGPQV